jgi:hypothetical protein
MKAKYLTTFAALILVSCNTAWRSAQLSVGGHEQAARNAIADFLNTSALSKIDSVFSITFADMTDGILGVGIYGVTTKTWVMRDGDIIKTNALPNNYIEQNGKLFYWKDSTGKISYETIAMLKKYNWVDTAIRNVYIPMKMIDETKKGTDYYFCKCNLKRYKKVATPIEMGHYIPPKLKCSCYIKIAATRRG